jgi:signal transduction histidine kinase
LEHALAALEHLPAYDPSVVAFAGHALLNYLSLTGGTVDLLQEALAGHPDRQVQAWLDGLHHVTILMANTVHQLINAAVTKVGALRFEPVELAVLAQRLCDYYQPIAARKDLRLVMTATDTVPLVWTDRVAAGAILDNLLSNAIKYSPPGRHIWVHVNGERPWAICSVQDEGPGLSPEEQAHLFQRGVRLSPVPTGGEPALGYGLAVAKELAEQLGGAIWCVSMPGEGACFSFRLPLYQAPVSDSGYRSPAPRGGPEPTDLTPTER